MDKQKPWVTWSDSKIYPINHKLLRKTKYKMAGFVFFAFWKKQQPQRHKYGWSNRSDCVEITPRMRTVNGSLDGSLPNGWARLCNHSSQREERRTRRSHRRPQGGETPGRASRAAGPTQPLSDSGRARPFLGDAALGWPELELERSS